MLNHLKSKAVDYILLVILVVAGYNFLEGKFDKTSQNIENELLENRIFQDSLYHRSVQESIEAFKMQEMINKKIDSLYDISEQRHQILDRIRRDQKKFYEEYERSTARTDSLRNAVGDLPDF